MRTVIASVAGILALIDVIPYIVDIIKGKSKPHIVSWLTWTLLLIIGTSAAFAAHQTRSALLTLGDTIGTGLVLIIGLKYGTAKYSLFDGMCQLAAILGLVFWLIFNSPAIAVIAVVSIDLIGSIPTIKHSWIKPEEETWQSFIIMTIASLLTVISLSVLSVTSLTYPIYLLLSNLIIALIVVYRRLKLGFGILKT